MSRHKLSTKNKERLTFRGTFVREGVKPGFGGSLDKTILLKDIILVDAGELVTDHIWFNYTKGFADLGALVVGDIIEFDARIKTYTKGYRGHQEDIFKPIQTDYKLSHPTKIKFYKRHYEKG